MGLWRAGCGGNPHVRFGGAGRRNGPPYTLAWLLANGRLTVRYERRADILTAFLYLSVVC
jgi:hypothetical protein